MICELLAVRMLRDANTREVWPRADITIEITNAKTAH